MKEEPSFDAYMAKWTETYQRSNYEGGLAAWFLRKSHEWCERTFDESDVFTKVLEVGAGTGEHVRHIRHRFDEYWMTDVSVSMLERVAADTRARQAGRVIVSQEDATRLSFADGTFDRVIAAHVLEHIPAPHTVLREWARVTKPGGVLSLLLPCDPGFAWRFGRRLGPRKTFQEAGLDYDYWMAREHVNPINNLVTFIHHYFEGIRERWLPFRVPSMDLNLFYVAHVRVG